MNEVNSLRIEQHNPTQLLRSYTMTNFVNMTPHALNVHMHNGEVLTFAPSGETVRVSTTTVEVGETGGMPVYETQMGEVVGLPEPQEGTVYLVSGMVLSALEGSGRTDVYAPGELVRNEAGQPVGCKGLRRNSR